MPMRFRLSIAMFAKDVPDAASQITLDVVVQPKAIITVRIPPVMTYTSRPALEQPPHKRSIRLQVEYIRAVHQSEQMSSVDRGCSGDPLVAVQRDFILPPHDVPAEQPTQSS